MGLDVDIYKKNKKGKEIYIDSVDGGYWFILTYLKAISNISDSCVVYITQDHIKNLIERCRDVLLSYYSNTFDWTNSWINTAMSILPLCKDSKNTQYDKDYIYNVSYTYELFLKIYEGLYDNETICIKISY